ncbi:N-acylmannosamine kinase [Labrenzia sp. CP4]|nr:MULTISPECIES: ROK family transcriptional regulator [unclassified Labrenzia]AMN52691.1 N-acylmannosamine kinase [Labrenzia sp. CP4]MEC9404314.1 ROK family transcriptional regulator [Pseudomonadota bacterium]MBO9459659.1 ROK family transcriptional regulator [Labrenzia sp. R5_0]MEE2867897.1 ROK family transcriptional regulator [Pseudomonadota bacterium]NKI57098.1 ROK family transcriptional regulator [Labrenzia sp. PO1]
MPPTRAGSSWGGARPVEDTPKSGRGSNSAQLRRYNERIVLQILRRAGEASKAELARAVQLTNAAIGAIIQNLIEEGLIVEAGKRHDGSRGQPATILRLAPRGAYSFGVRLDRTNMETVLMDFSGQLIARRLHDMILPAPEEAMEILKDDLEFLRQHLSKEDQSRITGIGLAQPFNLGAWLHELGLPQADFMKWEDFDLTDALEKATGLPVFSENDGTAAAVAELFYGLGRQNDNFVYLFLGPAIGGGLILKGDVVRGVSGNAGDVAMIPVPPSTLTTAPKARNSWDLLLTRASLVALARHMSPEDFPKLNRSDLQHAVETGDPKYTEWLEDCAEALALALRSAYALLDVPLVVLDGDLGGPFPETFRAALKKAVEKAAPEKRHSPDIEIGSFGHDAGAIGAASLPQFFNFSPRAAILTGGKDTGPAGAGSSEDRASFPARAARLGSHLATPNRST